MSVTVIFWYIEQCGQVLGEHVAEKGTVVGMGREWLGKGGAGTGPLTSEGKESTTGLYRHMCESQQIHTVLTSM